MVHVATVKRQGNVEKSGIYSAVVPQIEESVRLPRAQQLTCNRQREAVSPKGSWPSRTRALRSA